MTRCDVTSVRRPGGTAMASAWPALVGAALALVGCAEPPPEQAVAAHVETFGRFCTDCHNDAEAALAAARARLR